MQNALGLNHPGIVASLDHLAAFYCDQCEYDNSECLYRRALGITVSTYGPEDFRVANCLMNLAWTYAADEKQAQSETLYRRALDIRERVFGQEHPCVAGARQSRGMPNRETVANRHCMGEGENEFQPGSQIRKSAESIRHQTILISSSSTADAPRR